jgi:hypothetical protein
MTRYLALLAVLSAASLVRADEPPIIAKARAYVAPDAVLDGVKSIHFVGKITSDDPSDATKTVSASVEIIFQKPWQQLLVVNNGQLVTIGLDDYNVWQRLQDPKDLRRSRIIIPPIAMLQRIRADIWENLGFYRGIEQTGGRLEDRGAAVIDGIACEKIAFIHPPNFFYIRYFDQATGRLVLTETDSGVKISQVGEIVVKGIRLPKSLVEKQIRDGKEQTSIYDFSSITVNDTFPDSVFATPQVEPPVHEAAPAQGSP